MFTADETTGLPNITDGSGQTVPLTGPLDENAPAEVGEEPTGIVHSIDSILMPAPADPVVEPEPVDGEPVDGEPVDPAVSYR